MATQITFCPEETKVTPPDKEKSVTHKEFNKAIYEIFKKRTHYKDQP